MSRPYRVKSAGSVRNGTSGQETFLLKDQVVKLQQELTLSQAQCQKISDQLSCLISLVKRSWAGDKTAAIHVANIVGAAPPDYLRVTDAYNSDSVAAKVKSRPLNNWAVLTIGLLNRAYRKEERLLEVRQRQYLQHRIACLEEQELFHREMSHSGAPTLKRTKSLGSYTDGFSQPPSTPTGTPSLGPSLHRRKSSQGESSFLLQGTNGSSRPPSGRRKPPARPLFRPMKNPETGLTWSDLVHDPTKNKPTSNCESYVNGNPESQFNQEEYYDDIPYDDPSRYSMFGLFDGDVVASAKKRPPSGKVQKEGDTHRARPRSGVMSQKQERPLKYETTRPVSASKSRPTSASKSKKLEESLNIKGTKSNSNGGRAQSAKTRTNTKTTLNNGHSKSAKNSYAHNANGALASKSENALNVSYDEYVDIPVEDGNDYDDDIYTDIEEDYADVDASRKQTREEKEMARLMKVDVSKPESVKQFESEVDRMARMEREFQRTTLALQKKLGIQTDGFV